MNSFPLVFQIQDIYYLNRVDRLSILRVERLATIVFRIKISRFKSFLRVSARSVSVLFSSTADFLGRNAKAISLLEDKRTLFRNESNCEKKVEGSYLH